MGRIDCPKCGRAMSEWEQAGVALDHCASCRGLWFDRGELTLHLENLHAPATEVELEVRQPSEFCCPRCANTVRMDSCHYHEVVWVERCPGCRGIYLDVGEVSDLIEQRADEDTYHAPSLEEQASEAIDRLLTVKVRGTVIFRRRQL